ncbi:hypothetical protein BS78_01G322400 [Paspalum vaginatum]|nr:hypothetical protein BS78_01G322400 [Paspalum vaginatum]
MEEDLIATKREGGRSVGLTKTLAGGATHGDRRDTIYHLQHMGGRFHFSAVSPLIRSCVIYHRSISSCSSDPQESSLGCGRRSSITRCGQW